MLCSVELRLASKTLVPQAAAQLGVQPIRPAAEAERRFQRLSIVLVAGGWRRGG
jgi:hypothetical protein